MSAKKGIVLFGHGARDAAWAQPFWRIRELIAGRHPSVPVEAGFLELMRPTFDEAVATLAQSGVREIVVVPIFMAAGSHVKKDLPQLAAAAMERHPDVRITLAAPVGEAEPVLAAMADYALGALVA
jgi:sirohydrochlorin cobaltochelatase